MRITRVAVGATLVALIALAGTAAGAGTPKKTTCVFHLVSVGPPNSTTGEDFGTVRCRKFFGKGVQHDRYTVTPTSATTGKIKGRYKDFFDRGTTRGGFNITYSAAPSGVVTYTGTVTITGGTGRYRRAKGKGKASCTSHDGGAHTDCVDKVRLRHL